MKKIKCCEYGPGASKNSFKIGAAKKFEPRNFSKTLVIFFRKWLAQSHTYFHIVTYYNAEFTKGLCMLISSGNTIRHIQL
jgi:hypothetical protein